MYAIVATGGKQYKVSNGDIFQVEKLPGEIGSKVVLDQVLIVGDNQGEPKIGAPLVSGATVEAEIVEQGRAKKLNVVKKKRRKGFHKKQGHRQAFTALKVLNIANS